MHRLARFAARILESNLRELSLPYRLTYAVTRRCQARCAMCNIWKQPPGDELSLLEIDALFRRADTFSWINLTGGELFQRPDITPILLTVIRRNRRLYLLNFPTNGLQTKEIVAAVDTILDQTSLPRLIVSVSLDGPPEVHDRIRGISGCWDQALQTFGALRKRRSNRFTVYLGHTLQVANMGRFEETLDTCRARLPGLSVDDFHLNLAHTSAHYYGNADTEALPDPEQAVQEIEKISKARSPKRFDPVSFIEQRYHRHARHYQKTGKTSFVCQAAGASLFITSDGMVFPCTGFELPLGSLRENDMDLSRLWHSHRRHQIRSQVRAGNCPGCWTPCEAYQTLLANLGRLWKPS